MNQPGIDAEKLAALIDGRLDERERAQLLARLASSEDAVEVYADAAAAVRELESGEGKALPLSPVRRADRWRIPARRWLAAAAILAGVAVGGPLLWMRQQPSGPDEPGRFIEPLIRDPSGRGITLSDASPWSTVRGAGEPLTPDARAARLGARIVDLELAVWSGDTASARLATEAAALLEGIPAGAPAATMYRVIAGRAGAPAEELEPLLERARGAASELAGGELVQLGAWTQAARIAAARRDADFFRARETRSMLEWASGQGSLPEAARGAVQRVRSDLASGGPPDWSSLEPDLTELLQVLGR